MPKICVTEQSARRQRWIENGLLELMLAKPIDQISVAELCRSLELSRRSFYRYFRDLADVLDSLMDHTFQDMAVSDRPLTLEQFEKNYEFWFSHQKLLDALSRSGLIEKLYEYTLRYTDTLSIGKYMVPEESGADLSREASVFVVSGFISLVIAWHADGFQKSAAEMARIAWRLLFTPILKSEL